MTFKPVYGQDQPARLVVLISGNGSNLQTVLDACVGGNLAAYVAAVFSNVPEAFGLQRAAQANVLAICIPKTEDLTRRQYDGRLGERVAAYKPDWVLLLGWMRLLSTAFLDRFPGRVINIHPALPGTFAGTHAIERAYEAYQMGECQKTGVMIYQVLDEGVDCGPVLGQEVVPIFPDDDLLTLETRIHESEHRLLLRVLQELISAR